MFQVQFSQTQWDAWKTKANNNLRGFLVEFIQELNNAVVEATPVRTGFLRGSWFGAVGTPPEDEEGSAGRTSVAEMNAAAVEMKPGETYYAVNTANYAAFVEYGTRRMAPRAYTRNAIARAREIADMVATRIAAR